MAIKDEYIKFFENYKLLFKKYIKKTGRIPFKDGEITNGFRDFKDCIEDEEIWDEMLGISEPEEDSVLHNI